MTTSHTKPDEGRITPEAGTGHQFGAFGGVFTPSILTILGVIMFMRSGFVVGTAGIGAALGILVLSTSITLLTGLSIGAIATNTPIRGGGAYFMISRVLGPEFGGAIGLTLFFGQALSVPFYIIGFVEALTRAFPALVPQTLIIQLATAVILFVVVFMGANWAIRIQYFILTILGLAVVAFLGGALTNFDPAQFQANWNPAPEFNFWIIFAIYFPAVTGIMAGVNMSGDLKDPRKAIPRGTLAAIAVGFVIYGIQMLLVGGAQSRDQLRLEPFESLVSQSLFGLGPIVVAGVFAATLSSAIGSFLGAPRVLQALARDKISRRLLPFGEGAGQSDEPRRALILTFAITLGVLFYAGFGTGQDALNLVAVVVTMFFLYTYGMTNMAAFVESYGLNPSFRPRFRYFHWITALLGALGCGFAAFLVKPWAALVALLMVVGLFFYIRSKLLETAFGDARRGFLFERTRSNLLKIALLPPHPKNWRPSVLALTGNPSTRATLTRFAVWVGGGRGIVTLVQLIQGEPEDLVSERKAELRSLESFVQANRLPAFPEVIAAPHFDETLTTLLQSHSIGPLKPNLVMFGWPNDPERAFPFFRHLRTAKLMEASTIITIDRGLPPEGELKRLDIWWRGLKNGGLMLLIAHLLRLNWAWARAEIRVLRLVHSGEDAEEATRSLEELVEASRIDARVQVVISDAPLPQVLREYSGDASTVMLGFQAPKETGVPVFGARFQELLAGLPTTLLVSSSGDADLLA